MNTHPFLQHLVKSVVIVVVSIWTAALAFGLILFVGLMIIAGVFSQLVSNVVPHEVYWETINGDSDAKHTVVSIPISGVIVGDSMDISDPFGFFTESLTYGYDVKRTLYDLSHDDDVSGIILDINSPGGTIYGANAIADGVAYFREITKKPVVAFVSGMAASGGYWAAASADSIIADTGTSIGSIGVISGPFQYYDGVISEDGGIFTGGVVTERGIQTNYITAGKSKDLGNPYRKLTEEELESLQTMVNNEYATFVSYISNRRSLDESEIRTKIGALLYDTTMARELGLIDARGSREDAYAKTAELLGVDVKALNVVREIPKGGILKSLLETQLLHKQNTANTFCTLSSVRLVYHGDVTQLCPGN